MRLQSCVTRYRRTQVLRSIERSEKFIYEFVDRHVSTDSTRPDVDSVHRECRDQRIGRMADASGQAASVGVGIAGNGVCGLAGDQFCFAVDHIAGGIGDCVAGRGGSTTATNEGEGAAFVFALVPEECGDSIGALRSSRAVDGGAAGGVVMTRVRAGSSFGGGLRRCESHVCGNSWDDRDAADCRCGAVDGWANVGWAFLPVVVLFLKRCRTRTSNVR